MKAPLYSRISQYASQNRISFAIPGHKGKTDTFSPLDVTELRHTADLHAESDAVKTADTLLSALYKSERSFILTGGSTTAIHAMISSALKPGETLLVTPDCHMSVINICAVMGIKIRIADTEFNDEFLINGKTSSVLKYLNNYPDIRAVLITTPNYYGICSDIRRIADECHAHGKPLLIDEAHGAHFIASDKLPESSSLYADLVCHSAHKTLNALTGAAYLHCRGNLISPDTVRKFINIFETSSPSYVIAASADTARAELAESGQKDWDCLISLCNGFKEKIRDTGILTLQNGDPARLVLNFANFDVTGFQISDILSDRFGIDVEMADYKNTVLITSPKNTPEDFNALCAALIKITGTLDTAKNNSMPPFLRIKHDGIIEPQRALFSMHCAINLSLSEGYVSAATVTAYPPGTPIIIAGERITKEQINAIAALKTAGAAITGINDNMIDTVEM